MLTEIQKQLYDVIMGGGDVALNVIGAARSGKSHCLFGSRDRGSLGVVSRFAEAYFQNCHPGNTIALIELAIFEIYDEQVHGIYKKVFF